MANNSIKSRKRNSAGIVMRTNHNSGFLLKLKDHLKVLFQFDCAELNFGIYRILNYKRKEIEKFIEDDLIRVVEKEFEKYKTYSNKELAEKIEKIENKIKEDFGSDILHNGKLIEKYGETRIVKKYLELKKQIDEIDVTENIQSQVFNDLYNFFSRYYEDGDFISKGRYSSKQNKYAIPYSGEEVKLYWANFDQYYIKTGEVFKDYEFNQKGWKFVFRTVLADVPAGNVKGNRRYFFLASDEPVKISNKTCLIKFEYRMLTNGDLKKYPVKTKEGKVKITGIMQDELNPILKDKIVTFITPLEPKAILTETQDEKTIIEKHLYKYTRKITSDFFIHKNLKEFLERELDYFIKTEVLDIEVFDTEKERYFDRHITRSKVVKNIGERIIEFLSQIEDYQKMLWEKKKFVLKTDYVITIDRILPACADASAGREDFCKEILENKEQLKEWQELGFGVSGLSLRGTKSRSNLKLPVDTKYFSEEFKERLLERLGEKGNIDDLLDGILIKSENWQALNLILEKYKDKIQCIYIDPPFNTGTNEFLYKNKYLDSSWISMMYDCLDLGKKVLKDDGSIYVRIDYHGNHYVRGLMDMVFGSENLRNEIIVNRFKKPSDAFTTVTENFLFYSKTQKLIFNLISKPRACTFCKRPLEPRWHPMSSSGEGGPATILGKLLYPQKGRHWTYSQNQIFEMEKQGRIRINEKLSYTDTRGEKIMGIPEYLETEEQAVDSNWTDVSGYKFGSLFSTENAEEVIQRVIEASSNECDLVLDYFLGSGTTTAVAHKLGRKWIGVEMGDHFETVVLPRMKNVLFYDKSGISKEVKDYKGGGFFKYYYLEQYEDSLHNIEFPQEQRAQKMLDLFSEEAKSEYLMKYMLKFETEGSPSLLNLKHFENPFEYKLKVLSLPNTFTMNGVKGLKGGIASATPRNDNIVNVDLVETFNYLIGFKINKYKFIKDNGRKYVFVFGERNNRKTAIVWRATKDIDMAKDKEVIDKNLTGYNPDEIFINGDSFVKGYKPIESEFKVLMEG